MAGPQDQRGPWESYQAGPWTKYGIWNQPQQARQFDISNVPEAYRGSMGVAHPSAWEQLKTAVPVIGMMAETLSGKRHPMASMTPADTSQLIYPERVYSEAEQAKHPIRTGFDEFAGGLTSPENLLLMKGLGALGLAPRALTKWLPRIASGVFAGQMGHDSYKTGTQAFDLWNQYKTTGDERYREEALRVGTHAVLGGVMTALSGWHATTAEGGKVSRDSALIDKSGKEAKPTVPEAKPAPPPKEVQSRIQAIQTPPELKPVAEAKPAVAEDEFEQARRGAAVQKDLPVVNQIPEAQRASTKIIEEEKATLGKQMEARAAAKEEPKPVEARAKEVTTEIDRLKGEAGLYWDVYDKAWKPIEEAKRPLPGAKPPIEQKGPDWVQPSKLEAKQMEMRQRQQVAQERTADLLAQTRAARQKELDALRAAAPEAPVRTEVGGLPTPPESTKPPAPPIQAAEQAKGPGEPIRSAEKPEITLGEVRQKLASALMDEGKADKKTAGKLADHIMANNKTAEGLLVNPNVSERIKTVIKLGRALAEKIAPVEEPKVEPRSLRGDLGERPPAQPPLAAKPFTGKLDFAQRMALAKERVEIEMAKPENKGQPKTEIQRRVAEQIQKEFGGFGGSEPEDIRARREAKINNWINQLRDEKTAPKDIDTAFKQLVAYGLSHDEIIRRVSGAEGLAVVPPRIERGQIVREREDWEAGKAAIQEGRREGEPEIVGIIHPDIEELERMMKVPDTREIDSAEKALKMMREDATLHDRILAAVRQEHPDWSLSEQLQEAAKRAKQQQGERGFWRMLPAKRAPKPRPTGSTLEELTAKLESSMKATPPDDSRMRLAERLDKTITEGWDKVQLSLGRIAAQAVALKDMYMREPELTDYRSSIGRFSGALNRSAWELRQFTKNIKEKLPDQGRREAITNWIQAGGDDAVLADRAARSKGSLRAGYEAARTLTDDEKSLANMFIAHFDKRLKDAIKMDILKDGLDNYVPQIWKAKDQGAISSFFSSLHRGGLLKPDFNAAKKRFFESYFEGEQSGRVPVNKDIGFLVASWDRAFNQAIASRNLILDLTKGLAKDGRPIVAPSGVGRPIYESGSMSPLGSEVAARIIYPKAGPEETEDYRALNHAALTKHTWVGKGENGEPIFLKGDLRVHPDHARTLDNVINRGRWAADHPVQSVILKGQGFFKATLLSLSPFHQIQEGTHALFHKVNPFSPPQIDLTNPTMGKLLDHGLVIGNFDPVAAFDEGLTAGGGGLIGKIPGLGRLQQKYSEYLFQDYIPRLKAKMATEAYDRNMIRFREDIAKGKITSNQVAELTANQANAAFGELNYITMGRSPQTQAILRMMFLAPDFLEARAKFVGQALRPYGREQYAALFRGALGMYGVARVLNKLLDDDYHWDKPFSLIIHGYEYQMRSLPGDIWHMLSDENSFVMHRLNPLLVKQGWEMASGKDEFGRKRTIGEQVLDAARSVVPIPGQPLFKGGAEGSIWSRLFQGVVSSAGISTKKYRTKAGAMAHEYAIGSNMNDITTHHITELVQDITEGRLSGDKVGKLLIQGKMNPRDLGTAMELARLPELYRDYYRLPVELKAKVFTAATLKEKALLRAYSQQELDMERLLPEQRAEFMKSFSNP